jgi:hypothetical protein
MEMAVGIKNSHGHVSNQTSSMEILGSILCLATEDYNQPYQFKQPQNKWQQLKMAQQRFNSSSLWCIITTTIIIITRHQLS